jgi:hypothetical protein
MRISRTESARRAGSGAHAGRTAGARSLEPAAGRVTAARGPWAVVCAVVTVVLGPAAVTASALDQANAAPRHHTARADGPRAYATEEPARRPVAPRSRTGTA